MIGTSEGRGPGGTWAFVKRVVSDPRDVGAVLPSSRFLARAVAREGHLASGSAICELGAGTGNITRSIVEAAPNARLICFEPHADLANVLRTRHPDVDIAEAYADEHLKRALAERGFGLVDRVVSGLPFTMWDEELQRRVLDGVVDALRPGGRFVTYTYLTARVLPAAKTFRRLMEERFERVERSGLLWRNVPPAHVLIGQSPIARQ